MALPTCKAREPSWPLVQLMHLRVKPAAKIHQDEESVQSRFTKPHQVHAEQLVHQPWLGHAKATCASVVSKACRAPYASAMLGMGENYALKSSHRVVTHNSNRNVNVGWFEINWITTKGIPFYLDPVTRSRSVTISRTECTPGRHVRGTANPDQ